MWLALRGACEADEADALSILSAVGLKLVNKSIQIAYDSRGEKYDVPIFCINEPKEYDIPRETKFDKSEIVKGHVQTKLRCAGVSDIEETISTELSVESLKILFLERANLKGTYDQSNIRLFYEGKELKPSHLVGEYGVQNERVISVFLKKNIVD